jgi:hypothetical protein
VFLPLPVPVLAALFLGFAVFLTGFSVFSITGRSKPSWAGVFPIFESFVPQTLQTPLVIGAPFTVNPATASCISRLVLHFRQ